MPTKLDVNETAGFYDLRNKIRRCLQDSLDNAPDANPIGRNAREITQELFDQTDLLEQSGFNLVAHIVRTWQEHKKAQLKREGFPLVWHTHTDDADNTVYEADSPYHSGDPADRFKFRLEPRLRGDTVVFVNQSADELCGDGRGEELGTLEESMAFIQECANNILMSELSD